jgi:alpha-glucosidase
MIALLELTLPGLPTIYNGDEIGMEDGKILPHQVRDPSATEEMGGRDPQRTPMQWDATKNAGFTTGEPWLPVAESSTKNNVAQQMDDDESFLSLYQMLLHLRHIDPVLVSGSFDLIDVVNDMLVYQRSGDDRTYLVVLNFANESRSVQVPKGDVLFLTNRGDVEEYDEHGVAGRQNQNKSNSL